MQQTPELNLLERSPLLDARRRNRSAARVQKQSLERSPAPVRLVRAAFRLVWFCATLAWVSADYIFNVWLRGHHGDQYVRSEWCSRSARHLLRCINLHATYQGQPPTDGVLVCNHLSYLDIVVLAARQPAVFVSKADVRTWPVLGWLTHLAGTLYIRREKRGDVSPLNDQMAALVKAGIPVVVFPEGTSSDGHAVLPFYSSLLEPAAASGCAVMPAFIRYELPDGVVEDEVCYWRDMTFGPHFLNLLTKREIRAEVRFGQPRPAESDRKQLARDLQQAVQELGGF